MKLMFKQKLFSWFDSYDIFDEAGNTVYKVKGQLSWGHRFKIFDRNGTQVGEIIQKIITFLPAFEIYINGCYSGSIRRSFSLLPNYDIDFYNWDVSGGLFEMNYEITGPGRSTVATVSKKIWNFTDTYEMNIVNSSDALGVVLFVIAVDAEKCSRSK